MSFFRRVEGAVKGAIHYGVLLTHESSPIDRLKIRAINDEFGTPFYEAISYLKEDCTHGVSRDFKIYSNSDGGGASKDKTEACYKAISEALERWAFFHAHKNSTPSLRFDIDSTTTGFACFPGKSPSAARAAALDEAIERFLLQCYAHETLKYESRRECIFGSHAINIHFFLNSDSAKLLIASAKCPVTGLYAYGFSTYHGGDLHTSKAVFELRRNLTTLRHWEQLGRVKPIDIIERRLVFFSTKTGHDFFLKKNDRQKMEKTHMPSLIVDTKVTGPWDRYSTIWRALFPPVGPNLNSSDETIFYF